MSGIPGLVPLLPESGVLPIPEVSDDITIGVGGPDEAELPDDSGGSGTSVWSVDPTILVLDPDGNKVTSGDRELRNPKGWVDILWYIQEFGEWDPTYTQNWYYRFGNSQFEFIWDFPTTEIVPVDGYTFNVMFIQPTSGNWISDPESGPIISNWYPQWMRFPADRYVPPVEWCASTTMVGAAQESERTLISMVVAVSVDNQAFLNTDYLYSFGVNDATRYANSYNVVDTPVDKALFFLSAPTYYYCVPPPP
jgi:hypothetical protein